MQEIKSELDVQEALSASQRSPVVIYKHSPVCGLSDIAEAEVLHFVGNLGDLEGRGIRFFRVDVIGSRPASRRLEELLGVRHESPQVLMVRGSRCAWHRSHRGITADGLRDGVESLLVREARGAAEPTSRPAN